MSLPSGLDQSRHLPIVSDGWMEELLAPRHFDKRPDVIGFGFRDYRSPLVGRSLVVLGVPSATHNNRRKISCCDLPMSCRALTEGTGSLASKYRKGDDE